MVVDYGMGNLRSVSKALEHLGSEVQVSDSPEAIQKAHKVVLPGVGAFGDAVKELQKRKLMQPLQDFLSSNRPFLGICLGLQLLFSSSEESSDMKGLGIMAGKVRSFRTKTVKIPHMGWNSVHILKRHPVLEGIPNEAFFYFVHSYYALPDDAAATLAVTEHGGESFASVVGGPSLVATQFHPEKSQEAGLALLRNFLSWQNS